MRSYKEASGVGSEMQVTGHEYLAHYGPLGLFVLLMLGILGLPVPDEVLLTTAGMLVRAGKLTLVATFVASLLGSACGITLSFILGLSAGRRLLARYGAWLHIGSARYTRFQHLYEKFGRWTLLFGYFVPGFRHLTAIVAGTSGLGWRSFALFAYAGALVWVVTFLVGGFYVGDAWLAGSSRAHWIMLIVVGGLALGGAAYCVMSAWLRKRTPQNRR